MAKSASNTITVRRLAGRIGAELTGIDLSQPMDSSTVSMIRQQLLMHKVLFFRDQDLDHAKHIAFARNFGDPTYAHPHDDEPPEGFPEIYTVNPRRLIERRAAAPRPLIPMRLQWRAGWHTDVTPAINPPMGSILRADVVPEFGGDTTWSNTVAAYNGLSESLKKLADGLRAEHRYLIGSVPEKKNSSSNGAPPENMMLAVHPVVRVHPETGEKALFVNPGFTTYITGLSPEESSAILEIFYERITRPEYTVRFHWKPGSVAFWDNRATVHLGPTDMAHLDSERILHRVTIKGDTPVGPDGRESEALAGKPFV